MSDDNIIKFQGVGEERIKTHWLDWVWRIMGGTIVSILVLLMVTMFNQQNATLNNVGNIVNEIKEGMGKLKADVDNSKTRLDKSQERSEELRKSLDAIKDKSQERSEEFRKSLEDVKGGLIRIEEKQKALEVKKILEAKNESKDQKIKP